MSEAAILQELTTVLRWISSTTAEVNALSAQVAAWKGDVDRQLAVIEAQQLAILAALKSLTGPVRIALDLNDATRVKQPIPTKKGP